MISRRSFLHGTAAVSLVVSAGGASANEQWPTQSVRVVVPFEPGTGTDIIARTVREPLEDRFSQPVVIDNRPGAAGAIAMSIVARSAPDGYTMGVASPSNMTINHHRMDMPYNPRADFTPLSLLAILPNVITVHPGVPAQTFEELIEWLRENPNQVYSTPGIGTTQHLTGALLMREADILLRHSPGGGGAAVTDVIAGRIPILMQPVLSSLPMIQDGRLRAIAVTVDQRVPQLPGVPAVSETLPGFDAPSWVGFVGPANLPAEISSQLSSALVEAVQDPSISEAISSRGAIPVGSGQEEFAQFLEEEDQKMGDAVAMAEGN